MSEHLGFIGLGNMGLPIVRRLLAAGYPVVAFDTRPAVVEQAVHAGAAPARSVRDVADRTDTVLVSLPTPQVSNDVAGELAKGARIQTFVDLSTVGQTAAQHNCQALGARDIAALDAPVSGGVRGAEAGTLAVMVSGPRARYDTLEPVVQAIGRPIFVSERPGAAQTMKLVNNLMAAATLAATAEVMVMGVKAGLDATTMIDVLNAGSGATHASRDKFPRVVLRRTFDYGFATGLMTKDVKLYLDEAGALGTPTEVAEAVALIWERTQDDEGPTSDFTTVVRPMEKSAGVTVGTRRQ
jgi:3-hydroxyisobutyrate dehydrogenase